MRIEANTAKSSVAVLMDNMNAFEVAKKSNCRFGLVYDLGQIVKERAETAKERIMHFAMLDLGNAVQA